ncbi:MAG: hypothetical protein K6U74_05945 [Firmicutes bacterium]|nr:hypothetical protein [Bacillota bacterium]
MKQGEFSFPAYGVKVGAVLDVVFKGTGYYPPACRGVVEKVYPRFAVLKTKHYRVTIHYADLVAGTASVQAAQGPDPFLKVVWLLGGVEKKELEGRLKKKAAVR